VSGTAPFARVGIRAWLLFAACGGLLAAAGCTGPTVEEPPDLTPPLVFEEPDEAGLSQDLRRLVRSPLDAPVTASFRSASLRDVAREVSRQAGLGVGITPDLLADEAAGPIDLDVRGMPARHVLDWVTRLADAYYVAEGPRTVFLTRDRTWPSQDRLHTRSYPVGAFTRVRRPSPTEYDHRREAERLVLMLRYCLRHVIAGRGDARIIVDETGSRLTAFLPRRAHVKLRSIVEELKKPRAYEPPRRGSAGPTTGRLLRARVVCRYRETGVLEVARDLGRQAKVHVGFDLGLVDPQRSVVSLDLGEAGLGEALRALADAVGLGRVVIEPGRRIWILGRKQTRKLLRATGEMPWDRAVVRSYYVQDLADHFGIEMLFEGIRANVTPEAWEADLPVVFYHSATGRLLVIHDPEGQRQVAEHVDGMMELARPRRSGAGGGRE